MNSDVIMGLSKSLAWSAQHINNNLSSLLKGSKRDQVHIGSKDAVDLAIAGCTQSTIMLWALKVEIALKALYVQVVGKDAESTHSLSKLFCSLRITTQSSLDQRFQYIRKRKGIYDGRTSTIRQVLLDHKDDFVNWRYVYEQSQHAEISDLKPAIEAMHVEYQENHQG